MIWFDNTIIYPKNVGMKMGTKWIVIRLAKRTAATRIILEPFFKAALNLNLCRYRFVRVLLSLIET